MKRRLTVLVTAAALCALLFGLSSATRKQNDTPLAQRIAEYKQSGRPVPPQLLAQARDALVQQRLEASAALDAALLDGGSNSGNATLVDANPYVDSGNTTGKGNNASIPSCLSNGSDTAEDAWYQLDLPVDAQVTAWTTCESTGPPSYDTRLGLFDASLALITCNDDSPTCGDPYYQSEISDFSLNAGTYYIVVDGYNGGTGPYEINVTWTPTDPGCTNGTDETNAETVTTIPFTTSGSTVDACHDYQINCELGPGGTADDYWYTFSVDTSVLVDVWTTCDPGDIDTRLAVLSSDLNLLYCNDDDPTCPTGQSAISGQFLFAGDYFVVVEGADTTSGTYTINIDTTVVEPDSSYLLLPDIIVRESDLYDHDISTSIVPGRTHLRLSNGTANIGDGKLYIYGTGVDNGDGTENIMQRIYLPNGSYYDRPAGVFVFHPSHNHIHVEEWSTYQLRELLPNDGVGGVVAKGTKTSFCILDLGIYDSSLPNFDPNGQFLSCSSTIQGLSVGWVDVYTKTLAGQNIDITDVPDGTYWLESVVDPNDWFLEGDETNNATRIKVTLGGGGEINPDPYEPNDDTAEVDSRPEGGPNSPNLGPCNPSRLVAGLTVHVAGNDDYFKFYSNHTGGPGDYVSISFDSTEADLNLALLDSTGAPVDSSTSASNGTETISLDGHPEGWYYARISSPSNDLCSAYSLTVHPPSNTPPSIIPQDPPVGLSYRIHGQETFTVHWTSDDPEGDACWVSIYANTTPTLDGNEALLPTSLFLPAGQGFYIVNTAYLGFDTYWFYFEITDGGTTTGAWSPGALKLLDVAAGAEDTPAAVNRLYPATPNPFNPTTRLRFDHSTPGDVTWRIYDVQGRIVIELHNGYLTAGPHERIWDGRDRYGRTMASGVYFQRVVAGEFVQTSKLVLLK